MTPIELETRYAAPNYQPLPVTLTRGAGAHLWDVDGRRYVDMMSAYSAASHGHSHPRILGVLTAQANASRCPLAPTTATNLVRFSKRCARAPGLTWRCR